MSKLNIFVLERIYIDAEAVVLRGYLDLAGFEIFHGVICAAVAEFELEGFAAKRKPQNLMAQAYSENWNFAQ
jgi:hypothetical protein